MAIKVCYIFIGEEIWAPLIRRQVLELLDHAANNEQRLKIRVVSVYPWYWQLTKRKQFKNFQSSNRYPFEIKFLPIWFPVSILHIVLRLQKKLSFNPHDVISKISLFLISLQLSLVLLKYHLLDGYSIFHCRSYPASSVILKFKKLCPKIKLIFDPRSDYPEENVTRNLWKKDSPLFRFWKEQERKLLKYADMTICITRNYLYHYQNTFRAFNYAIIPNNVDSFNFKYSQQERIRLRKKHDFDGKVVFCYLGTIGINSWHCPGVYAEVIRYYSKANFNSMFLFLVPPGSKSIIDRVFYERGINTDQYAVISPEYFEVPEYLSAADFGLFYLKNKKIALGTKVVEYNSVGLPVLVNSNAISAASYVSEAGTGKVIDINLGDRDVYQTFLKDMDLENICSESSRKFIAKTAQEHFDNAKVSAEYIKIYHSLNAS